MTTFFGVTKRSLSCLHAFLKIGRHFALIFGICPDFRQIKTIAGALAPPPPTPLDLAHGQQLTTKAMREVTLPNLVNFMLNEIIETVHV